MAGNLLTGEAAKTGRQAGDRMDGNSSTPQ